jgi:replication factor C subunit 3/5
MSRLKLIVDNVEDDEDTNNSESTNNNERLYNNRINNVGNNDATLPWIEKYRPQNLGDVVEHEHIVGALRGYIKKKFLPHLLFYGPPGTGKTSTIIACANELYGKNAKYMVLELNASDERGIDVVRKRIKTFAMAKSLSFDGQMEGLFKLVILDEIDAMTQDAQAILKKLVEMHTLGVRFCLICNFIQKIDLALQSRCTTFRFAPLAKKNIIPKVNDIIKFEKLNITNGAIDIIVKRSNGDMRKILNQLQAISMAYDCVTETALNNFFGYPCDQIINNILNATATSNNFKDSFNIITSIKNDNNISITEIISEIHDLLVAMLTTKKSSNSVIRGLNVQQITKLITMLKQIELNQNISTNETIQTAALVAAFKSV